MLIKYGGRFFLYKINVKYINFLMLYGVIVFGYVRFRVIFYGILSLLIFIVGFGVIIVCVEKFICFFIKFFLILFFFVFSLLYIDLIGFFDFWVVFGCLGSLLLK